MHFSGIKFVKIVKNNLIQRPRFPQFWPSNYHLFLKNPSKPITSGFRRKCVGGPQSWWRHLTQRPRLPQFWPSNYRLFLQNPLKPMTSGLNRKCVGRPKNGSQIRLFRHQFTLVKCEITPYYSLKSLKPTFFWKTGDFRWLPEVGHGRKSVVVPPRSFLHVLQPEFMAIIYASFPPLAEIWETLLKEKVVLLSPLAPPGGLESKIWPQIRVFWGRLPLVRSFIYEKSNIRF